MATALQQQLAAIAANSTHQLDLKAQKARHSKSLLFEPRDAATQTFETIYQISLEGFEDLCHLDSRFVPFARNLFSEQSKSEDRTQMTAKENEELDRVIESFLGLLGGRLLLKPAIKAAEWLVRRFSVHERNTEAVLFTFLPYHSTHIFPTLLSILPEQLPVNFRFLHPYVSSLQSPPRHAVVAAASNHPAFFTAFSKIVLGVARAGNQSAPLLGFWASITAQAVNGMVDATRSGRETIRKQKEEDLLLKVLPVLQNALSIKGAPELYLGSCMVIVILATKASLSDKVLNALMEAVAGSWNDQTVDEGMTCLAVLAEEKDLGLPSSTIRAILQQPQSLDTILRIGGKCRVEKLLVGTSLGAVETLKRKPNPFASAFLQGLPFAALTQEHRLAVMYGILQAAEKCDGEDDRRRELATTLKSLAPKDAASMQAAARKANVDLSRLDADLPLLLRDDEAEEEEDPMEIDHKPVEDESTRTPIDLEDLPELPSKHASFLDTSNQSLFEEYRNTFQKALPSEKELSALLNIPSLERTASTKQPSVFTFFARIWTSDVPLSARLKALQITVELLQHMEKEHLCDMQALLPYVIAGLSDPIKSIRSASALTCRVLGSLYAKTKASELSVWGKADIYGKETSQVAWLAPSDAQKIVSDGLLPLLEDCVIDGEYILHALPDTINATAKTGRKELKSGLRAALYSFLASHAVVSPVLTLKLRLLSMLRKVGKAAGPGRSQILLPYIRARVAELKGLANSPTLALKTALVACVTHRSADELQFLRELSSGTLGSEQDSKLGFDRIRDIWPIMKVTSQAETVHWMLKAFLNPETSEDVQSNALETLRSISLPTEVLVHLVENLPNVADLQEQHPSAAKRQRTSRVSEASKPGSVDKSKLDIAIRRITIVLELIEGSKAERHPQLLKGLFHLLSELHHYKALMESELVYLQQLLVNSLLSVVSGLKAASNTEVDRSVIRADLIVDTVRTTSNPQVRQVALLLMSALASWAPDLVLHSVMPLFTFMSSTILKQGDEYSAHVTDQTVASIIPPLADSLKKRGKELISGAADLLLSFTAAYEHIPLHRRHNLFQHLVQTLGARESLFAIVAMLIERYPDEASVSPFVSTLMDEFAVSVQLHAVRQYLDLIFDTRKSKRGLSDVILVFGDKNAKQATTATSTLLEGLSDILSRRTFRKSLAKELMKGDDEAESLRIAYSEVLERTIQLDLQLKDVDSLSDNAGEVLTALLGLMPTKDFIDSSAKLMQTGSDVIRQQVFWSLEQRVNTAKRADNALQQIFMEVLPNCAAFVIPSQPAATRLAAITCIDRIAEKFGKTDRAKVAETAQVVASDAALGDDDHSLRRMSLLCLASMVEVLGGEFIPILPRTLDRALQYLEATIGDDETDYDLLAACFSLAMAVLDHVPWMLSGPYLERLLRLASEADEENAKQFNELAAKQVPVQDCLSAIDRTWKDIVTLDVSAVQLHVDTLHAVIKQHTKSEITKNAQLLFSILSEAFDLRRRLHTDGKYRGDDTIFDSINNTTMDAVLKLNDATFRPFFLRLGEWAFTGSGKDRQGLIYKATSLYSFAFAFFEQLKSLVTSYVSFILDNSAGLLQTMSPIKEAERELLVLVVRTLSSNFASDQDGFWQSPSHFDTIAKPLLELLKKASILDPNEHIIPAITELAAAANSPEHHKTINSFLTSDLMRHEDAAVKLAAVKCERALTGKLNIEWCQFIPEWLPFISELQEDDDGAVERETLRWIKQVGEVTGEDLNSMLQ
ncbi:U3 small nucleolar RNA-associated 10 [Lecanosticta acicola]|uniref:U3 small nucleolar RNA-associated protein 10 n=1 Tax=Lecanosticta acicola TaxID=111012 RepID=A0AAI9ECA0_9PEZI|nr:U3 small nucleolar RNA-associated 10 [Lecanosticta acicola]